MDDDLLEVEAGSHEKKDGSAGSMRRDGSLHGGMLRKNFSTQGLQSFGKANAPDGDDHNFGNNNSDEDARRSPGGSGRTTPMGHASERDLLLFKMLDPQGTGTVTVAALATELHNRGLKIDLLSIFGVRDLDTRVDFDMFSSLLLNHTEVADCFLDRFVIPQWAHFTAHVQDVYETVKASTTGGKVASYIPQLARIDGDMFGVAVCTINSQHCAYGDTEEYFSLQSCSKAITYGIVVENYGTEYVHRHVGREPSGRNFNELALNDRNLPHNPMINAGAIMCCSLVKPDLSLADRFQYVATIWQKLAGNTRIEYNNAVYHSERGSADRNFCLGHLMQEKGAFPPGTNLIEALEFYFMCCSFEITCSQLAVVAATLANDGICPVTSTRIFSTATVRNILSLMYSCGMYDYSGEFAFRMGFPCKSGVGGGLMTVIPGKMGIATWSPRLDVLGNSVSGIETFRLLGKRFNLHVYDQSGITLRSVSDYKKLEPVASSPVIAAKTLAARSASSKAAVLRRMDISSKAAAAADTSTATVTSDHSGLTAEEISATLATKESDSIIFLFAACRGDMEQVRKMVARGVHCNTADYDSRTALHLAACEGHTQLIEYLMSRGADTSIQDRFGNTALDDTRLPRWPRSSLSEARSSAPNSDTVYALLQSPRVPENPVSIIVQQNPSINEKLARCFFAYCEGGYVNKKALFDLFVRSGMGAKNAQTARLFGLTTAVAGGGGVDVALAMTIKTMESVDMSVSDFVAFASANEEVVIRVLTGHLCIPEFPQFSKRIASIYRQLLEDTHGELSQHLPDLKRANPDHFGIALCSVDGQLASFGDAQVHACVHAISKPITYAIVLEQLSKEAREHEHIEIEKFIGLEPSGRGHSDIVLDQHGRPHNALINAGSIMACSLLKGGDNLDSREMSDRFDYCMEVWKKLTGDAYPGFSNTVYLNQMSSADRAHCLAYFMRGKRSFPNGGEEDIEEVLRLFFQMYSIELNCEQLSIVAATLANDGVCPVTQKRIFGPSTIRKVLSILASCGMYEFSGEFAFKIGLPAKSGASGFLLVVVPRVTGFCVYSPRLDGEGNSVRGMRFCEEITAAYEFHAFASVTKEDRDLTSSGLEQKNVQCSKFLMACGNGDVRMIRNFHSKDPTLIDYCDYDGRTPLHVAAAEGKIGVVRYLLSKGAGPHKFDRWGQLPLNDAERRNFEIISKLLREAMGNSGGGDGSPAIHAEADTSSSPLAVVPQFVSSSSLQSNTDRLAQFQKLRKLSSTNILTTVHSLDDGDMDEVPASSGHGSSHGIDLDKFEM